MSLRRHQRAWEDLGRVDPFWAVLTSRENRHGRWDPAEFFASGDRQVAGIMDVAGQLGLPHSREAVLDFGCGLGRFAQPLARHFENYTGVDISAPMLTQAEQLNRDCTRCRFVLNTAEDLRIFGNESFDLVHSRYVLQHLPSRKFVVGYLRELVRVLRPGGLLVFQLPGRIGLLHQLQPRRRLYEVLRSVGVSERILLERLELTPMHMRFMPVAQVVRLMTKLGGTVVRIGRECDVDHVYFVAR